MAEEAALPTLERVLAVAKEGVFLAGKEIRAAWHQKGEVKDTKSNETDLVTETDNRCEELIINLLKSQFPEHQIIGEESAGASKYELTDAPTWTIDPIDGTTNFVHRIALSCVLIAFLHKREVLVGVVYDPISEDLFWATKGGGAFLKSRDRDAVPIHVSGTTSLNRAVISMDPGYGRTPSDASAFCNTQRVILERGVRNVRVIGSTGLNMAYVACGRLDAGFEQGSWSGNIGPKIWDFAAGKLLVEEAGGVSHDLSGSVPTTSPLDLLQRSFFCAATKTLALELQEAIAEGRELHSQDAGAKRARH